MLNVPLTPKQPGRPLRLIVIGRLSQPKDTPEETQRTIDSSFAYAQEWVHRDYHCEVEFKSLGEQISGMVVDRRTILEALELMESGEWDVILTEDLSRIYRNPRHQYSFVQDCVDAGIRLICIADGLDSADENWETMLGAATLRHGLFVPDTRRRIKRTAKFAFHKGGMVQRVRFGYRKLTREEAASGEFGPLGLRIARMVEHQGVFDEIRHLLIATKSSAAVVAWLNREKIPTGPYVKRDYWNIANLKTLVTDSLLHGTRQFRKQEYKQRLSDGSYHRKKNPNPEIEHCPELAFMTRDEQEEMLAAVGWEIAWGHVAPKRTSPRTNVPRGRSIWPGQAATCAVCGGSMLVLGKALKCCHSLKVNGASCWNHVQVPVDIMRDRMLTWLHDCLDKYPAAHEALVNAALQALKHSHAKAHTADDARRREIDRLAGQQANLVKAIAEGGQLKSLLNMLTKTEHDLATLQADSDTESAKAENSLVCTTPADVTAQLDEVLRVLLRTSMDFADVLKQFFTTFVVYPVQALDTGQVHPRAVLRFNSGGGDVVNDVAAEVVELVFDVFKPPVHIGLMPEIVALQCSEPQLNLCEIAARVGTSHMTVKRALRYAKVMEANATRDPFVVLTEKPHNASRWRHAS